MENFAKNYKKHGKNAKKFKSYSLRGKFLRGIITLRGLIFAAKIRPNLREPSKNAKLWSYKVLTHEDVFVAKKWEFTLVDFEEGFLSFFLVFYACACSSRFPGIRNSHRNVRPFLVSYNLEYRLV